jgi:hypothetical protein
MYESRGSPFESSIVDYEANELQLKRTKAVDVPEPIRQSVPIEDLKFCSQRVEEPAVREYR